MKSMKKKKIHTVGPFISTSSNKHTDVFYMWKKTTHCEHMREVVWSNLHIPLSTPCIRNTQMVLVIHKSCVNTVHKSVIIYILAVQCMS